jgi:predicted TIM-barrel fold metal-dependent hydrolase
MTEHARGVIDVAVHPAVHNDDEFRSYLPEPWKSVSLSHQLGQRYTPPFHDYHSDATPKAGDFPGSDPALAGSFLFDRFGIELAILVPLTRSLVPNPRHGTEIAAATNEWLAAKWLGEPHGRFRGSIRVCPTDPRGAVAEIEKWAGDPRFVQVAVPLSVHAPYGQERYDSIWAAAASHGLPVAVHADGSGGVELAPTMAGYPTHFAEYHTLFPMTGVIHLASLICSGVFNRFPDLKFVFGDGGIDLYRPLLWRLAKDWKSARYEMPWVDRNPLDYLTDHVRFVVHREEGPEDEAQFVQLLELTKADDLLMFGSNYPFWNLVDPQKWAAPLTDSSRSRVLMTNARELYRLEVGGVSVGA